MATNCYICHTKKDVCCGIDYDDGVGPTYCKDCCPDKVDHELQKQYGYTASSLCECLKKVGRFAVEVVRNNSVVGQQTVISCNCCGRLHIRVRMI